MSYIWKQRLLSPGFPSINLYLAVILLILRNIHVFILIILRHRNGKKDEISSPPKDTQYIVVEAKITVNNTTIQRFLEKECVA